MRELACLLTLLVACKTDQAQVAKQLAQKLIIADGHVDVPYRLQESKGPDGQITEDLSQRTPKGDFDFVRAKEGGLDAPFMSIYVPAKNAETPGASKKLADELIDMVEGFEKKWPDKFAIARTPAEVRTLAAAGKIALPMGIENGSALENDVANVAHFYFRGIRYITLTHSKNNLICDSSGETTKTHGGLSEFGKQVVAEMNKVGIMIDVSHLSDDAIRQVLELSKAPVIASHSSCRHFTPAFSRNLPDELIREIAKKDGVIMINFGSAFISAAAHQHFEARNEAVKKYAADNQLAREDPKVTAFAEAYAKQHPQVYANLDEVLAHFDYVVKMVGIDHVGFGSDFDGVGDSLPRGLEDVSKYPNLIRGFLERGYSEADIEKICSGNVFRVWNRVAELAGK